MLSHKRVLFQCDNQSVVAAIQKGSSKDGSVMHLLRCLWFFVAYYDIDITSAHTAGIANTTADHISRNNLSSFFSKSTGTTTPHITATITTEDHSTTGTGLDIRDLQAAVQSYYFNGIAPSTRQAYITGQSWYIKFSQQLHILPLPTSESTLLLFSAYLAKQSLVHTTIKVYLSAIRHLHITHGLHNAYAEQLTPRVQLILKGIKKMQLHNKLLKQRLPTTVAIMTRIYNTVAQTPNDYHSIMIWAACCLAFFWIFKMW